MNECNFIEKMIIKFIEKFSTIFSFKLNSVKIEKGSVIRGLPYIKNQGLFKIGKDVVINSMMRANPIGGDGKCIFIVKPGAELIFEDGVGISNSTFYCCKKIHLGKNVFIGGGCKIYDTDFHSIIFSERIKKSTNSGIKIESVKIESGAFIGAHSLILKGVTIGKNSVIGAGSVVAKNIPSNEIWAGNPARFLKKIIS